MSRVAKKRTIFLLFIWALPLGVPSVVHSKIKANLSFTSTGNASHTLKNKISTFTESGAWQNTFEAEYFFKKTNGSEDKNDLLSSFKRNYSYRKKEYLFGELQIDDDQFREIKTRNIAAIGYGYKFLRTDRYKMSNEISIASLWSKNDEIIIRNSLWFQYKINDSFKFTNKLLYESGKIVLIRNQSEIEYKLSDAISLGLSHKHTHYQGTKNVLTTDLILKKD